MSILRLNGQSLNSTFGEITLLQGAMKTSVQTCFQATWISSNDTISLLEIDGYNMISQPTKRSLHGCLMIYLKCNIKYDILPNSLCTVWENQTIKIRFKTPSSRLENTPVNS